MHSTNIIEISGPDLGYLVGFARSSAYLTDEDLENAVASHKNIEDLIRSLYGYLVNNEEISTKHRYLLQKVIHLANNN